MEGCCDNISPYFLKRLLTYTAIHIKQTYSNEKVLDCYRCIFK